MRYEGVEKYAYPIREGVAVELYGMREYPVYQKKTSLKINSTAEIEEIASRPEIYGDDAEGESYKIVDFNIVKLFENDFEMTNITKLEIPL